MLEVEHLTVRFGRHRVVAVDDVSFSVPDGGRVGLIGESGSGKSVTALAVMGLLPDNAVVSGSVRLSGREVLGLPDRQLARLRGDLMSMVFQEPMTSLDPTMKVGRQVAEVLLLHGGGRRGESRSRVIGMLAEVGVEEAERVAASYPHQLSGGQRQRVLMAMALINAPGLVICDEPTTALDVTVQATVLATLDAALTAAAAACLFISHDLAVVSRLCDHVLVMRQGCLVDEGPMASVVNAPQHPYTAALLEAARLEQHEPGSTLPTAGGFAAEAGAG